MNRIVITIVFLALLVPAGLRGQGGEARGVEFWGGSSGWAGDDVEGFEAGFQLGATLLGASSGPAAFGLEVLWGRFDSSTQGTIDELGLGLVGRYALGSLMGPHLFLQGRVGWIRLSAEVGDLNLNQTGVSLGPELGLEVPLSSRLRLVVGGGGSWTWFGDANVFLSPGSLAGSSGSAFRYGGRGGIVVGMGP